MARRKQNGKFSLADQEDVKSDEGKVQSEAVVHGGAEGQRQDGEYIHGVPVGVKCDDGEVQRDASEREVEPERTQVAVCVDSVKEDGKDRGDVFVFVRHLEEVREWGDV